MPLLSHLRLSFTRTPTLSLTLPLYSYTPYPCQVPLLSHRCLRLRCAHPECRKHALLMQRPPLDCDLCARPLQVLTLTLTLTLALTLTLTLTLTVARTPSPAPTPAAPDALLLRVRCRHADRAAG